MLTADQVNNWERLKAAEHLADVVDKWLSASGTKEELRVALRAYWATAPDVPEKAGVEHDRTR